MKSTLFFILIIIFSCKEKSTLKNNTYEANSLLSKSKNILNFNGTPKNKKDRDMLMFSDKGAWFAYSFPDTITNQNSFSGPFLMTQDNGTWISAALSQLIILSKKDTVQWLHHTTNSYTSHLEQKYTNNNLTLTQKLVFNSGHTALIESTITNNSTKKTTLDIVWQNTPLYTEDISFSSINNELHIKSTKTNAVGYILFPQEIKVIGNSKNYTTIPKTISLNPSESKKMVISQTFIFPKYSWEDEKNTLANIRFENELIKTKQLKNSQLQQLINNQKKQFSNSAYSDALIKANLTLQCNWRISAGELKYDGLFPSYHYEWFHGFWSWDSWKHAVGLSYYDLVLAKNQLRAMFDFQLENGFVLDCVYRDTTIEAHNFRDTKPPLSAWAVVKIYKKEQNIDFVKEFYPKLKKYHKWWYKYRDHDKDGLCEYGSTDGSLIAAKWESGMDNAIRFDNSNILKNDHNAFSLDQESVDLNAYLFAEKIFLEQLATALQLHNEAKQFSKEALTLKEKIQTQFFDPQDNWFYDTDLKGTTFIKGEGSEGWIPLWAKAATKEQALSIKNKMMNPTKFFTKVPFQTMSADHPKFDPMNGYWRGPNWLDQSYFGVQGLRNYGFEEEANLATIQILKGANGILDHGSSIRENYHPITGEGLYAKNFSWSAAHIIMLLTK
jgi:glucosidase